MKQRRLTPYPLFRTKFVHFAFLSKTSIAFHLMELGLPYSDRIFGVGLESHLRSVFVPPLERSCLIIKTLNRTFISSNHTPSCNTYPLRPQGPHSDFDQFIYIRYGNVVSYDRISMRLIFLLMPEVLYQVVSEAGDGGF